MDYETRLQRALDFVDANLAQPMSLEAIASRAFLSCYHFARLFRSITGRSVMEYVRARRLAVAVHRMRDEQDTRLLQIAMDVGFETQQGFTSAFKKAFGVTPGAFRNRLFALPIQEKIVMAQSTAKVPLGPEFRIREAFKVAGLAMDFDQESKAQIPELWTRFSPSIGTVPGQRGFTTYGVCIPTDPATGNFRYIASVEVDATDGLPEELTGYEVPACKYAVFTHQGSLDHLQETVGYIFGTWLPESEYELTGTADFELYDGRFNPHTGSGEFEIWIPIGREG